jgi:ATP-dependent helicase HrpB
VAAATALLGELGALAPDGRITEAGRQMAALGAHPRLASMMLAARTPGESALAADLSALLEERDPLRGPDTPADIGLRLAAIAADDPAADRAAISRIRRAAGQYRRRLRLPPGIRADGDAGRLIGVGFPDRIAQRRGEPGSFRLAGGGGARLSRSDPLSNAPLLAIAALELRSAPRIRLAARLDPDALPAERITEQVETSFDPKSGTVLARRRRRLGALVLADRTEPMNPAEAAGALAQAAAAERLRSLHWSDAARQLRARVGLMRQLEPDGGWPDLSDQALTADVLQWLPPQLGGMSRLADLDRLDLVAILSGLLPRPLVRRLDAALPTHLVLPGGRAAIDYTQPVPVAASRAQSFFGMTATPQLADGRVPLRLALLSPAGRPAAITGDLAGFWRTGWAAVRRDMLGRYPKHAWPEDPGGTER